MKVREEREKVGLELNIQKMNIMVAGSITLWQIDRETMETVWDFIFGGSKITADGDCCHEMKRCLLLGRRSMLGRNYDQPRQHIKKQRHYFDNKVCLVKAMVFPVFTCGCESWTVKKAECQRKWCFWTVVLEKTLESPLDCRDPTSQS